MRNDVNSRTLCVAIPTYNRCEEIRKKIECEINVLSKYDIDVYIFDSSTDSVARDDIDKLLNEEYENLFLTRYNDMPSSNEKVYRIFEWAESSGYRYVWMIHDHTVCEEESVRFLLSVLEKKEPDFLLLNMQASEYKAEEITKLDDFLLIGAWRLNSFGASVLRTDTFLCGVDWNYMREKYGGQKTLNYSHIGFYFERASQLTKPIIVQTFFDRKDFYDFNRTKRIQWEEETLRICLECWGEVISRLPECYTNKLDVLRSQDKWFLSKYSMIGYRRKGYYNFRQYIRYWKWLKLIYPEDIWRDCIISILPYQICEKVVCGPFLKRIKRAKKHGESIYIFGAGRHAVECALFLDEINTQYDGFIVTSKCGNPDVLLDHNVYEAEDELIGRDSLIILAILSNGIGEVEKMLNLLQNKHTKIETIEMS